MSTDFDWVTDEEGGWPELPPPPSPKTHRSVPWRGLLLLCLALVVGGSGVAWQVQQRVAATTATVTEEVRDAYTFYGRVAQTRDAELLKSLISGSSPVWWQTQLALLPEGLLLERWPMGLLSPADATPPEIVTITPSPDFMEVEVVAEQTFDFVHADGRTETTTLQTTTHFRRGADRWLVVPPTADFWGKWQVQNGTNLSIIYPERDEEEAKHLLLGLEAELARACRELELPCPAAGSYTIRLDSDPDSLLQITDPVAMLTRQPILNLPAPSLVGRPIDVTGEQALLRAYAAHFITAVLVYNAGWHCCEQGLFHQALIDYQLAQLDLRPWPLQSSHYQAMMHDPLFGVAGLGRFWHEPPTRPLNDYAQPQIYALVDVLLHQKPDLNPYTMQQRLTVMDNYQNWIASQTGFGFLNQGHFQRAWLENMQEKLPTLSAQPSLPTQDVLLLCRDRESASLPKLYRYSWQSDFWSLELDGRRLQFLAGLPGDEGVLLQEQSGREQLMHVFSWVNGRERSLATYPAQSAIFRVEPVNDDLLFYVFKFDENSTEFNLVRHENCAENACDQAGWLQPPVWSPDGRWFLETEETEQIWLRERDSERIVQVRHGRAPFWLNNIFYGYLTNDEILITSLAEVQGPRRYALDPLQETVLAAHPGASWSIHTMVAAPGVEALFVAVSYTVNRSDELVSGTMLLHYDLAAGTVQPLFEGTEQFGPYSPLTFSPDGRWLNMQSYTSHEFDWQLDILNLETGQQERYRSAQSVALPGYDWSADGRWLLRVDDEFLHLSDPEAGVDQLLIYSSVTCNFATWVE
ncbi:MAG: hypothetical protein HC804_01955 [Anaerolineae bacterium]|nr:hypothetical protein [Anaerolineae bacterium]